MLFDAQQRGPEERAAMLEKLGLERFAYDWRGEHVPTFEQEWDALAKMLPHLRFLNLNGMTAEGDKKGKEIMVLGQGDLDVELARTICASGYTGPIGILNHTDNDAEARLLDKLDGLD